MGLEQILKSLLTGGVKLQNWTVSHNGHPLGVPTLAETKIDGNTFRPHFKFKEHNADDDIEGKRPLIGGGSEEIKFNSSTISGGHIALRLHVHGVQPRLEVRFVLKTSPDDHYRFDADVV